MTEDVFSYPPVDLVEAPGNWIYDRATDTWIQVALPSDKQKCSDGIKAVAAKLALFQEQQVAISDVVKNLKAGSDKAGGKKKDEIIEEPAS